MASIREQRKAQIREALEEANAAYKEEDYETALKWLQPYNSNKKVQHAIQVIEAARQKNSPKRKVKPSASINYPQTIGISVLVVCGLLFFMSLLSNNSPSDTSQPSPISTTFADTYYSVWNGAYVRSCPQGDCEVLASLPIGEDMNFIEAAEGDEISGSIIWYKVTLNNGREGYVHSSVVADVRPTPRPPTAIPPQAPIQRAWDCNRNYDCSDFATCSDVSSYMSACSGDPSNLDGDADGYACERECGS